jgi:hypothetical protein
MVGGGAAGVCGRPTGSGRTHGDHAKGDAPVAPRGRSRCRGRVHPPAPALINDSSIRAMASVGALVRGRVVWIGAPLDVEPVPPLPPHTGSVAFWQGGAAGVNGRGQFQIHTLRTLHYISGRATRPALARRVWRCASLEQPLIVMLCLHSDAREFLPSASIDWHARPRTPIPFRHPPSTSGSHRGECATSALIRYPPHHRTGCLA